MSSVDLIRPASEPSKIPPSRATQHEEFLQRIDFRGAEDQDAALASGAAGVDRDGFPLLPSHHRLSKYHTIRARLREPMAEFFGTMALMVCGDGCVAQTVLSSGTEGNFLSINMSFGVGLMLGYLIAVAGGAAGHLNPAITLANCLFRRFPWRKFPEYLIAQMLGSGFAAAIVFATYRNSITAYDGGHRQVVGDYKTAGIFATYPTAAMDLPGRAMQEFTCTAFLTFFVNAIACQTSALPHTQAPLPVEWNLIRAGSLGIMLTTIGNSLGWQTGYAMNAARDFAPRLVSYMCGYGPKVFTTSDYYFWIPIFMPCFGAIVGQAMFDFFIYQGVSDNFITDPTLIADSIRHHRRHFAKSSNPVVDEEKKISSSSASSS
ncbi:aquaporin-like protein [Lipomyces japonicus]|uniref:aquaporin-like protein n=1 Tax=Lipomyces japonicus TaxID=56871 RepID=UPI0034CDF00B